LFLIIPPTCKQGLTANGIFRSEIPIGIILEYFSEEIIVVELVSSPAIKSVYRRTFSIFILDIASTSKRARILPRANKIIPIALRIK
jgi:hypothetical protein